jgi:hypothetical protein
MQNSSGKTVVFQSHQKSLATILAKRLWPAFFLIALDQPVGLWSQPRNSKKVNFFGFRLGPQLSDFCPFFPGRSISRTPS